jgi:hypothetical protein
MEAARRAFSPTRRNCCLFWAHLSREDRRWRSLELTRLPQSSWGVTYDIRPKPFAQTRRGSSLLGPSAVHAGRLARGWFDAEPRLLQDRQSRPLSLWRRPGLHRNAESDEHAGGAGAEADCAGTTGWGSPSIDRTGRAHPDTDERPCPKGWRLRPAIAILKL